MPKNNHFKAVAQLHPLPNYKSFVNSWNSSANRLDIMRLAANNINRLKKHDAKSIDHAEAKEASEKRGIPESLIQRCSKQAANPAPLVSTVRGLLQKTPFILPKV
jgi:hypothetical protein